MEPQATEFLLVIASILLVGISVYMVWLWLNLWLTSQVLNKLVVIQTNSTQTGSPAGSGCASFLFCVAIVATVIGFLAFSR